MNERFDLFFILFYTGIPFLVIGLIGNVLVIRIIHKREDMKTPTNFLLMSLAFSDVITILLWPLYFFEFAEFVCKLVVLIEISIMVSSITLTLLAVEKISRCTETFSHWFAIEQRQHQTRCRFHLDRKRHNMFPRILP